MPLYTIDVRNNPGDFFRPGDSFNAMNHKEALRVYLKRVTDKGIIAPQEIQITSVFNYRKAPQHEVIEGYERIN